LTIHGYMLPHMLHRRLPRLARQFVALITLLVLSLSQFAVAMHQCADVAAKSTHHTLSAQSGERDCDCPTESDDNRAICKQHCESGSKQQAKPGVFDVPVAADTPSIPVATLPTAQARLFPVTSRDHTALDPPFLRSLVLLI
jgi:hypothetical protein